MSHEPWDEDTASSENQRAQQMTRLPREKKNWCFFLGETRAKDRKTGENRVCRPGAFACACMCVELLIGLGVRARRCGSFFYWFFWGVVHLTLFVGVRCFFLSLLSQSWF